MCASWAPIATSWAIPPDIFYIILRFFIFKPMYNMKDSKKRIYAAVNAIAFM